MPSTKQEHREAQPGESFTGSQHELIRFWKSLTIQNVAAFVLIMGALAGALYQQWSVGWKVDQYQQSAIANDGELQRQIDDIKKHTIDATVQEQGKQLATLGQVVKTQSDSIDKLTVSWQKNNDALISLTSELKARRILTTN